MPGDVEAVCVAAYIRTLFFTRPDWGFVNARVASMRDNLALVKVDYSIWMGTTEKSTAWWRGGSPREEQISGLDESHLENAT